MRLGLCVYLVWWFFVLYRLLLIRVLFLIRCWFCWMVIMIMC